MNPKDKATLTLPFVVVSIISFIYFLFTYPNVFVWILIIPSVITILGSIWYGLYRMYGGKD